MKFDHLVLNVDKNYQNEGQFTQNIRDVGLPYSPKKGKGTKGFKATNIWIGKEYFEMISIKNQDGGGWKKEWVDAYNNGERGLICLMLDVKDLNQLVQKVTSEKIPISQPESIKIEFFFKLISKTMPWTNSYLDFFQNVPMQIGFQQMNNEKTRTKLEKYMVPNSRGNNITGIKQVQIAGQFTKVDFEMLKRIFDDTLEGDERLTIHLEHDQVLILEEAAEFNVQVVLNSKQSNLLNNDCWIENTQIINE
ncbi:VOC family protein [Solibacillus cecembensis]|uniref:VOC family protein n=1 Tax=Solibacillus cecembensis TaxID=459347 RepID=UPI003CFD803F